MTCVLIVANQASAFIVDVDLLDTFSYPLPKCFVYRYVINWLPVYSSVSLLVSLDV